MLESSKLQKHTRPLSEIWRAQMTSWSSTQKNDERPPNDVSWRLGQIFTVTFKFTVVINEENWPRNGLWMSDHLSFLLEKYFDFFLTFIDTNVRDKIICFKFPRCQETPLWMLSCLSLSVNQLSSGIEGNYLLERKAFLWPDLVYIILCFFFSHIFSISEHACIIIFCCPLGKVRAKVLLSH